MKHLKVGDKAPSWSGKDQNGKAINQKSYEGKKEEGCCLFLSEGQYTRMHNASL